MAGLNIGRYLMEVDKGKYDTAVALLNVAVCPACDGSGSYPDNYGEQVQCQWCYERGELIEKAYQDS